MAGASLGCQTSKVTPAYLREGGVTSVS